ncbi:hypothetical protein JOB18_018555 [Solea senegalensis]|uniref:Uncharacterized protein n=1 Tax=Solea senegalensis TaxID=28829 RepID=A0AAV6SAA9_SOLSE|nr:hypothetical protein JOB18_018555 [Solea senegalensis]
MDQGRGLLALVEGRIHRASFDRVVAMDRSTVVNYFLGLLGLFLLQGVLNVDGRSMFNSGNHVFNPKEDTEAQSKVLALLLHKSLVPVETDDPLAESVEGKPGAGKGDYSQFGGGKIHNSEER